MAQIIADHVSKAFEATKRGGRRVRVFDDLSLKIANGEFVTLFGPNGCGKTTVLNLIAGVLESDSGQLRVDDKHPNEGKCGYVFQDYVQSLLPWRTVRDNIGLPLELNGTKKSLRIQRVEELLEHLEISLPLDSYPYQLSGGQQQLVAISRGLIGDPQVLLMDEPFNQLDYLSRLQLNDKLLDLWRKTRLTVVFVSHDLEEALVLADRVLFLGNSPTVVVAELRTGHEDDRDHHVVTTAHFRRLMDEALRIIEENALQ